ncbi:NADH-quinone oxidoreductase subunit N [bacterium]|nr:NADH-quinone oxidoreductase subunit N [bacterium]MBU1752931.1 NADH-quinone oxidoreductase subunit N [bacterium]
MNYTLLTPEIIVCCTALLVLVADLFMAQGSNKRLLGWLAIAGLIIGMFAVHNSPHGLAFGNRSFVNDSFAVYFKYLFLGIGILVIVSSMDYLANRTTHHGEYYFVLLLVIMGTMFMVSSGELISLYVSLELLSVGSYVLVAYLRTRQGIEGGIKYLLFGAFCSAVLLYGIGIIYGMTGTTEIQKIGEFLSHGDKGCALLLGLAFTLAGFGFKIACIPFHFWVPEAYEGAPTPITAFLASASKAASFAVFIRVFIEGFGGIRQEWIMALVVLCILTIAIGNLSAIPQANIKRLLAYSSIGHAGYLLIGLIIGTTAGLSAVMFYLLVYALATLGIFMVIAVISNKIGTDEIEGYAGMYKRSPFLCLCMLICLASLAGLPPLAGFMGKFYLFAYAVHAGYIYLAVIGFIFSTISVYYYFRILKSMYLGEAKDESIISLSPLLRVVLIIIMLGLFLIGILPQSFISLAIGSVSMGN